MLFSQRLKDLLKSTGYSQAQLADNLGVVQQTVSKWVNGKAEPDITTLIKCAALFNVSIDYLLGVSNCASICIDTKKDPSPEERERAVELAAAAVNGAADPQLAMPGDLAELSELVRQIVNQALDERNK